MIGQRIKGNGLMKTQEVSGVILEGGVQSSFVVFWDSAILSQVANPTLSFLYHIPLYEYPMSYLHILLLVDIWVVSSMRLLQSPAINILVSIFWEAEHIYLGMQT